MASEAQRLIGISLTKIAQSRSHRGGVSLHKNLLVATVLQKARYIFMEEAYNMVHYHPVQQRAPQPEVEDLVGLTAEEAGLEASGEEVQDASCVCQDKENLPPPELTYLDLDKTNTRSSNSLKRRRAVAEWETEEAVQSILPKKVRQDSSNSDSNSDDSVFLDDATLLSDMVSKEVEAEQRGGAMEIDRITSLVSIFSFSMGANSGAEAANKLNRSQDLCSTQAKDTPDGIQQRPFLAMTV